MFVAVAGAGLLACAVAYGASVDARTLVLRVDDAPALFTLDSKNTRYVTNAAAIRLEPKARLRIERAGRVTGYVATYSRREGARVYTVTSAAQLMRSSNGAAIWLADDDDEQRTFNQQRRRARAHVYQRQSLLIGSGGWMYWITEPRVIHVEWRVGRAVGALLTWGLSRERTIGLARSQAESMRVALG